jgi:hypothetical protein
MPLRLFLEGKRAYRYSFIQIGLSHDHRSIFKRKEKIRVPFLAKAVIYKIYKVRCNTLKAKFLFTRRRLGLQTGYRSFIHSCAITTPTPFLHHCSILSRDLSQFTTRERYTHIVATFTGEAGMVLVNKPS